MNASEHIDHLLQELLDGELDADAASKAEQHLERCDRCRGEWAALRRLVSDVQALPRVIDPPRDLWNDIAARLGETPAGMHDAAAKPEVVDSSAPADVGAPPGRAGDRIRQVSMSEDAPARRLRRRRRAGLRMGLAAAVVAAATAVIWLMVSGGEGGWAVERLDGRPLIARQIVGETGVLRTGQWLETDGDSRARLSVGTIGEVAVEPGTRVQLRRSALNDYRIALAEGRIEARIWAPPRLFYVETPSATAIDLGCAYTLDVDSTGKSLLHVTSGYVELEKEGKSSVVPAGAMCYASPELGPGTVFAEDAAPALRRALERYDFGGAREEDLAVVLDEARPEDAITLWQLVEDSDGARRERVYEKLSEMTYPPAGVTREGVLSGDDDMFEMWRLHLGLEAVSWWGYLREKLSFPD